MKQQLAAIALTLIGLGFMQPHLPAPDPSGRITLNQVIQQNGGTAPATGLLADPSGVAVFQVMAQKP